PHPITSSPPHPLAGKSPYQRPVSLTDQNNGIQAPHFRAAFGMISMEVIHSSRPACKPLSTC
ncbi:MAG: hypothetical protein WA919_09725, partial [Coleofasciculaceae cyanobacterium]